jgi:hypothetical protein
VSGRRCKAGSLEQAVDFILSQASLPYAPEVVKDFHLCAPEMRSIREHFFEPGIVAEYFQVCMAVADASYFLPHSD